MELALGWLLVGAGVIAAGLVYVHSLRRRIERQRVAAHALGVLADEVLAAGVPSEILKRLAAELPGALGITSVRLRLYDRGSRSLRAVPAPGAAEGAALPLSGASEGSRHGAVACFLNRTPLAIPDARRSPLESGAEGEPPPRSVLFVPLLARNEAAGVLELAHATRSRRFSPDEQSALQRLANQIAASIRLAEQQSMREQLFRSEKLASVGQLISGVAGELKAPLEAIASRSSALLARKKAEPADQDLVAIAAEARRAGDMVARLVSFARAEQAEVRPIELGGLLNSLVESRSRQWQARGLSFRAMTASGPAVVLGSRPQLEQVLLNLLIHAEQAVARSSKRTISAGVTRLVRQVLVEVSYPTPDTQSPAADPFLEDRSPEAGALGLAVCRGIVQSHGGEIRFARSGANSRFELELPLPQSPAADRAADPSLAGAAPLTLLLVEPDPGPQRQLLNTLGARGHRVVPVPSAETAIETVERLRFDIAFCSVRQPGLSWVELFDRIRYRVGAFVLLTEGYDQSLANVFRSGEGYILSKPVEEPELLRLLAFLEMRFERSPGGRAARNG